MTKHFVLAILGVTASVSLFSGCASYPTESATTIDNRPQISFQTKHDGGDMTVFVDGIRNGVVSDFIPGESALRVIPGTHTIIIQKSDGSTFTQRVFVSDGVTKTIVVP